MLQLRPLTWLPPHVPYSMGWGGGGQGHPHAGAGAGSATAEWGRAVQETEKQYWVTHSPRHHPARPHHGPPFCSAHLLNLKASACFQIQQMISACQNNHPDRYKLYDSSLFVIFTFACNGDRAVRLPTSVKLKSIYNR